MKGKRNIAVAVALVLALTCLRWPNLLPPSFSPVYAIAFCSGVYLAGRLGWWLPLTVLLATDVLLNLFYYSVPALGKYMLFNYVAAALIILLGRQFNPASNWRKLLAGGLLGAVLFYLITNTASWLNDSPAPYPQAPYPKTLLGWLQALTIGVAPWPPTWTFFRNTLLSGGLFTGLFIAVMKWADSGEAVEKEDSEEVTEPQAVAEES